AAVEEFAAELVDRFGALPDVVESMLERSRLRIWAHEWGIHSIHRDDRFIVLAYGSRSKLKVLVDRAGGQLRVADGQSAYFLLSNPKGTDDELIAEVKS